MKIAACESCKHEGSIRIFWSSIWSHRHTHAQLGCDCGTRAKWMKSKELAVDSWNQMQVALAWAKAEAGKQLTFNGMDESNGGT